MKTIEKIRAEIERRIAEYDKWIEEHPIQAGGSPIRERREELASLKEDFLDTLQEPEVDLEKASRNVYESWMGGTMNDVRRDMVELGKVLNARKKE